MMLHSKQQVATVQEVRRQASRYILWKLGDRLWAGEPTYNERRKRWTVPIHSRSLPADIELGHIILDAHGTVVRAPSRRALGQRIEEIDAILELEGRTPRTRDDSRVRALALATKARRELKLPAKAIDWPKLFAMVAAEYAQGRTEGEINWEQVVADCKLEKKAPQAVLKWAYGLAAVIVLGLFAFAWNREAQYRGLDKQFEALTASVDGLKQQNASLQQENETLRKQMAEAVASRQQTRQQVAQLQAEKEELQRQAEEVAALVFEFVTKEKPVHVAMAQLRGDATRGEPGDTSAEKPALVLKSPMRTAVRTTTPTLQWEPVPGAQAYQVIVLDSADNPVWEDRGGTKTQVTMPEEALQRGQVYSWQVKAMVEGQSHSSPIVRFWVIDEKALREVEAAERNYPASAVVLASVYEAHGLYEDSLAQLERLTEMNPEDPFAKRMLNQLRRQLGKE